MAGEAVRKEVVVPGLSSCRIRKPTGTWSSIVSVMLGVSGTALFLSSLFVFTYVWPVDYLLAGDEYAHLLLRTLASTLPVIALLGPVVLYIARRNGITKFWDSIEWNANPNIIRYIVIGAVLAILYQLALKALFGSAGTFPANSLDVGLYVIAAVLLQPLVEEVYFRGILFVALERRIRTLPAIIVVTIVFAFLHPQHRLYVLPVAIALGTVRVKARSVAACFLLHASYNLVLAIYQIVFPSSTD